MLCPHGCGVRQVIDVGEDDSSIQLDCSHSRGELLALQPGRVSLEHLNKKIGTKLFPASSVPEPETEPKPIDVEVISCMEAYKEFAASGDEYEY
jgi:hypothetical protein